MKHGQQVLFNSSQVKHCVGWGAAIAMSEHAEFLFLATHGEVLSRFELTPQGDKGSTDGLA